MFKLPGHQRQADALPHLSKYPTDPTRLHERRGRPLLSFRFKAEVVWAKQVRTTLAGQNLVCIPPRAVLALLDMSQNIQLA